jgi:hypothetical protein
MLLRKEVPELACRSSTAEAQRSSEGSDHFEPIKARPKGMCESVLTPAGMVTTGYSGCVLDAMVGGRKGAC